MRTHPNTKTKKKGFLCNFPDFLEWGRRAEERKNSSYFRDQPQRLGLLHKARTRKEDRRFQKRRLPCTGGTCRGQRTDSRPRRAGVSCLLSASSQAPSTSNWPALGEAAVRGSNARHQNKRPATARKRLAGRPQSSRLLFYFTANVGSWRNTQQRRPKSEPAQTRIKDDAACGRERGFPATEFSQATQLQAARHGAPA